MEGERADENPARRPCRCGGDPGVDFAMEGDESAYEGIERLFKLNSSVFRSEETESWGQYKYRFVGRTPAEQPDYPEALKAFRALSSRFVMFSVRCSLALSGSGSGILWGFCGEGPGRSG